MIPQFEGGIIKFAIRVNTFEVGHAIQLVFLKEKKMFVNYHWRIQSNCGRAPIICRRNWNKKANKHSDITSSVWRENKWYQWSKVQFSFEADSNTRYFHNVVDGRHRKKVIHYLHQDDGFINSLNHITQNITENITN